MKAPITIALVIASFGVAYTPVVGTPKQNLTPTWTATPTKAGYYINSVAVSGDGTRTVGGTFYHSYGASATPTSTGTFGTYCYDRTGTLLWKDEFTGWQGVYWVDISANGAWAASGGWFSQNPDTGFVRAYNAATGSMVLNYSTTARVNQVAVSADGTWLVSAANTLVLFQRTNGAYTKSDEFSPTGSDTMETIALSADAQYLVAGDYAGNVMLFSITNGKLGTPKSWALPGGDYSHSVRINPKGTAFAAGGSSGNFYLFDVAQFLATGNPTVTYQVANAASVYGVAVADDGQTFAGIVNSGGSQGAVYYVQRQGSTGNLLWSYSTQHNPNSVTINAAAGLVAVADGHPDGTPGNFYLLNSASGALKGVFNTPNMSWPIEIADNGTAVVAGSDDSSIYYFANAVPLNVAYER